MKARKVKGVWQLKELGFENDPILFGKHPADVEIGFGEFLNLANGETLKGSEFKESLIASCSCLTKTPEARFHDESCTYRKSCKKKKHKQ